MAIARRRLASRKVMGERWRIAASVFLVILLGCQERSQKSQVDAEDHSAKLSHVTPNPVAAENVHGGAPILTNQSFQVTQNLGTAEYASAAQAHLMSIWRSAISSSDERAEAVMKLFPRGTSLQSVQALLGDKGTLSHSYGPSISFTGNIVGQAGTHDFWEYEYQTPSGIISLRFEMETGQHQPRFRFERAYSVQIIKK